MCSVDSLFVMWAIGGAFLGWVGMKAYKKYKSKKCPHDLKNCDCDGNHNELLKDFSDLNKKDDSQTKPNDPPESVGHPESFSTKGN